MGNETKERYEKHLREESTQLAFRDFHYYNDEFDQNKKETTDNSKSLKKEVLKKEMLKESNSSYNLIKKDNKKISANPMPSLMVGNMFEKAKMDKSPSLLDNRMRLFKKTNTSLSTSSLFKNNSNSKINISANSNGSSIMSTHKRTGSSSINSKPPLSISGSSYKM